MSKRETVIAVLALIVIGVVTRLLPHVPNFAPVTATALFCGAYLPRRLSILAPLIVLLISDYLLLYIDPFGKVDFSTLYAPEVLWHNTLPYVYFSFGISAMVGWLLRTNRTALTVVGAAVFCSIQFFLITNAAVWIAGGYDRSIHGLWQSYVAGLPFYKGTLLGDLLYTSTFFGLYELTRRQASAPEGRAVPVRVS
jgi:hypothetical protein